MLEAGNFEAIPELMRTNFAWRRKLCVSCQLAPKMRQHPLLRTDDTCLRVGAPRTCAHRFSLSRAL